MVFVALLRARLPATNRRLPAGCLPRLALLHQICSTPARVCTNVRACSLYALFQRCGAPEFAMWAALIFCWHKDGSSRGR